MSSDKPAVSVRDLSKCYHIYDRPRDRLKQFILPNLPGFNGGHPRIYFREFWALKDVSFEIPKGETFGIIGRNGSGKSTLLQLICGTLSPTSGSIEVDGRIGALLELGAGFNPEFTGVENVYLGASLYGLSRAEVDSRFDDIAAFADIGNFIEQPVKTYSSGMYVRLAFAVIANIDAQILVIDEALAVGDAYFVQKCMRFLRAFMQRGTLLFVSHDLGAVSNLCSRALLLNRGSVEMIGRPKSIMERYLAAMCEETQGESRVSVQSDSDFKAGEATDEYWDARTSLIQNSNLRNDLEVFRFQPDSGAFGTGEAKILSVKLLDEEGRTLKWTVGGETVNLRIQCASVTVIERPIVGFVLKDRLGQGIFGDNTFLSYQYNTPRAEAGAEIEANFTFRMPILPTGDYSFSVAIAEGSQEAHVQHHWMHEALLIRAHASSLCFGAVGVPMRRITLSTR